MTTPKRKLIHSYSSLAAWMQCPRLHQAQFVEKKFKFVETPAIIKGNEAHKKLEVAFRDGHPPPEEFSITPGLWEALKKLNGYAERQKAMDRQGNACGFFENDRVWIRGKIDIYAGIPDPKGSKKKRGAIMVDWKTGNPRYTDYFQADVYGAFEWAMRRSRNTLFAWQYVNSPLKENPDPLLVNNQKSFDLVTSVAQRVDEDTEHVPRPSWKCRFCQLKTCEYNENKG